MNNIKRIVAIYDDNSVKTIWELEKEKKGITNKEVVALFDMKEGEKQVLEYLTNNGRICIPMYGHKNIPQIITPYGDVTSPDIISIMGNNKSVYIKSKKKSQWVKGHNFDTERETGVENKLWREYCKLVKLTNTPLEIYFLHEKEEPTGLYRIKITRRIIEEYEMEGKHFQMRYMVKNGLTYPMLFIPFEKLEKLY